MRKKMLKNASFLVIVAVFLSFVTASLVMYEKVRDAVKGSIRDEAEYVRTLMEAAFHWLIFDNLLRLKITSTGRKKCKN